MLRVSDNKAIGSDIVVPIEGLGELWAETLGDIRISVAILDGPVDQSHPSLASAHLSKLETLVSDSTGQGRSSEHGTHITSVIFGLHDGPVKGIAPSCSGVVAPIFSEGEDGCIVPCSQLDVARGITQAIRAGAHIINISGGEYSETGTAHTILEDAVRECARCNILVIAAAGNNGCECLHIPGALPSVLAVGAMNANGAPLPESNWGKQYHSHGILAPGENIVGASPGGSVIKRSGTSYATAMVSGIAALLLSLQLKHGQKPNPLAVREALLSSAAGWDDEAVQESARLLGGRLDVKKALSLIVNGGLSTMPEVTPNQDGFHSQTTETVESYAPSFYEPTNEPTGHRRAPAVDAQIVNIPERTPTRPSLESRYLKEDANSAEHDSHDPARVYAAASCTCGNTGDRSGPGDRVNLVFALGTLGYDFGTETRRDSVGQHMGNDDLQTYLEKFPSQASAIIWTLNLDATPIYAVRPQGAYAIEAYQLLQQFLREQFDEGVEIVSIPGIISGRAQLMSGQVVPVIVPETRCMYSWTTAALVGDSNSEEADANGPDADDQRTEALVNFLRRIYDESHNLGITPQDRALNYAATNIANARQIFDSAYEKKIELQGIDKVTQSPICRPNSDCWDVNLVFFDPENVLRAKTVYRFTVDVSDVCPVMVGRVRSWTAP